MLLSEIGINKGSAIYLHVLHELSSPSQRTREVAFYHRNTSEPRKKEILEDLQLPLGSEDKLIKCVVATVSLGNYPYQSYSNVWREGCR